MEIRVPDEDDTIRLYKASLTGCVLSLNTLLQKDPLILRKVSLTPFSETPLHVAALLGHHDFTTTLVAHNPNLARELDSSKRAALHLASAEGHKNTVQALLPAYADACLLHDEDGRIPLHYAAMRGRVEVLNKLIEAKPESVYVKVPNREETVLHFCVKYNQLECLKLLVEEMGDDSQFLNSRNSVGGNTILHLAVTQKQIETIRYLVSLPIVRAEANAVNGMALTTLDILEQSPRDFRSLEIQQILVDAGIRTNIQYGILTTLSPINPSANSANHVQNKGSVPKKRVRARWWRKLIEYFLKKKSDWLVETRGMLMVVATMISTMTFQATINPPGGVWQETIIKNTTIPGHQVCTEKFPCVAGTAVFSYGPRKEDFREFLINNTITFLASLTVTLILISGIPLHNQVCVWILSMVMFFIVGNLTNTYQSAISFVTPKTDDSNYNWSSSFWDIYYPFSYVWDSLLFMAVGLRTIPFLIWLVKRLWRRFRHIISSCKNKVNV